MSSDTYKAYRKSGPGPALFVLVGCGGRPLLSSRHPMPVRLPAAPVVLLLSPTASTHLRSDPGQPRSVLLGPLCSGASVPRYGRSIDPHQGSSLSIHRGPATRLAPSKSGLDRLGKQVGSTWESRRTELETELRHTAEVPSGAVTVSPSGRWPRAAASSTAETTSLEPARRSSSCPPTSSNSQWRAGDGRRQEL